MNNIIEISRLCCKCNNANCSKHCPLQMNIPMICHYVSEGNYDEASNVLFRYNPFPYVTSLLCSFENQCFGNCLFDNVKFYEIENKLAKLHFDKLTNYPKNLQSSNIIIIGGGICGLTVAHYLLKSGIRPTIYEKNKLGGVITSAIPNFRFDDSLFQRHIDIIESLCDVKYQEIKKEDFYLLKDKTIIFAIGSEIEIVTIDNNKNVYSGVEVLKQYKLGLCNIKDKKVAITGLGNTACDVARAMKRLGNHVEIIYRRDIESSPANKVEIEDMLREGIIINEKLGLESFDNNVLVMHENQLVDVSNSKRKQIIETNNIVKMNFDVLIEALGSKPDNEIIKEYYNQDYLLVENARNDRPTNIFFDNNNSFIGGDAFYGAWNIAYAIRSGLEIVKKIVPTYLFGGSFNPITKAHSEIISYLSKQGNLILVPNGDKYTLKDLLSFDIRKKMIDIELKNIKNIYNIEISDFEKSTAYKGSIETLRYFNHPIMVIGDDCIYKIDTWIKAQTLIRENKFLVITRNKDVETIKEYISNNELLNSFKDHFEIINILEDDVKEISSSDFRNNFNLENISEEVLEFIKNNKLYEV